MPLLKLETTAVLSEDQRKALLATLSKTVAETTGKPEQYVMITIAPAAIAMSGTHGNAAFVDIRGIGGLSAETNRRLSQKACQALHDALGIPPTRVYLNFTEIDAANWGWNGSTFG